MKHFLEHGPRFIFLFHPSLGPLWDIIAQKMRGGALAPGSELVLEVRSATLDALTWQPMRYCSMCISANMEEEVDEAGCGGDDVHACMQGLKLHQTAHCTCTWWNLEHPSQQFSPWASLIGQHSVGLGAKHRSKCSRGPESRADHPKP